jgi:hypothetical protein
MTHWVWVPFFLTFFSMPAPANSPAKSSDKSNAFLFELGGPGLIYSLGFERQIVAQSGARIQVSGLALDIANIDVGWLNSTISGFFFFGEGPHYFETTLGIMGSLLEANQAKYWFVAPTLGANYRWQSAQRNWDIRVGPMLIIGAQAFRPMDLPLQPWLNASLGFHF